MKEKWLTEYFHSDEAWSTYGTDQDLKAFIQTQALLLEKRLSCCLSRDNGDFILEKLEAKDRGRGSLEATGKEVDWGLEEGLGHFPNRQQELWSSALDRFLGKQHMLTQAKHQVDHDKNGQSANKRRSQRKQDIVLWSWPGL